MSIGQLRTNIIHGEEFLNDYLVNGYSPNTVRYYRVELARFSRFLDDNRIRFEKLTKRDILKWKASFDPQKHTPGSINRAVATLRSFFRWLVANDYPCPIPSHSVTYIKQPKLKYHLCSEESLLKLVEGTGKMRHVTKAKCYRALFEILLSTGMRIQEALNLNIGDVKSDRVLVMGKGNKERFCYITPRCRHYLDIYLKDRTDDCPALFATQYGGSWSRLLKHGAQQQLIEMREKLGITEHLTYHSLRHYFATKLIENGATLPAVMVLMGHSKLGTVQVYLNFDDKFAESQFKQYFPLQSVDYHPPPKTEYKFEYTKQLLPSIAKPIKAKPKKSQKVNIYGITDDSTNYAQDFLDRLASSYA